MKSLAAAVRKRREAAEAVLLHLGDDPDPGDVTPDQAAGPKPE
jgi:CTP:molybdopterin cytidylyltransferase MocA